MGEHDGQAGSTPAERNSPRIAAARPRLPAPVSSSRVCSPATREPYQPAVCDISIRAHRRNRTRPVQYHRNEINNGIWPETEGRDGQVAIAN